jgi:hypothetical protein
MGAALADRALEDVGAADGHRYELGVEYQLAAGLVPRRGASGVWPPYSWCHTRRPCPGRAGRIGPPSRMWSAAICDPATGSWYASPWLGAGPPPPPPHPVHRPCHRHPVRPAAVLVDTPTALSERRHRLGRASRGHRRCRRLAQRRDILLAHTARCLRLSCRLHRVRHRAWAGGRLRAGLRRTGRCCRHLRGDGIGRRDLRRRHGTRLRTVCLGAGPDWPRSARTVSSSVWMLAASCSIIEL